MVAGDGRGHERSGIDQTRAPAVSEPVPARRGNLVGSSRTLTGSWSASGAEDMNSVRFQHGAEHAQTAPTPRSFPSPATTCPSCTVEYRQSDGRPVPAPSRRSRTPLSRPAASPVLEPPQRLVDGVVVDAEVPSDRRHAPPASPHVGHLHQPGKFAPESRPGIRA